MCGSEPSTQAIVSSLSQPLASDTFGINRRRFLQAAAFAGTVTMLPSWMSSYAEAATPLGSGENILVHVILAGGNDTLNTVVPFQDGAYYDGRGGLALAESETIKITSDRGLHPRLSFLADTWGQGNMAIIEGVGSPTEDLSHFSNMARWMSGKSNRSDWRSGWLGRYIDNVGGDYAGVHIDTSVPLIGIGNTRSAIGLPPTANSTIAATSQTHINQHQAIKNFGAGSSGLGQLGDLLADTGSKAIDISKDLDPVYSNDLPEDAFAKKMAISARLINANLGVRVINVMIGGFDTHSGQANDHDALMTSFNNGLRLFYQTLGSAWEKRTLVMTASEFGRRVYANGSNGTDHGAGSSMMVFGSSVEGGLYGEAPSIKNPDRHGNLAVTVDYRSVYTTAIDQWFGGDGNAIFGARYEPIGFLSGDGATQEPETPVVVPPTTTPTTSPPTTAAPKPTTTPKKPVTTEKKTATPKDGLEKPPNYPPTAVHARKAQIVRLYSAYFLRLPDIAGLDYWVKARQNGESLADVSANFADSTEFKKRYGKLSNKAFVTLVYKNVLKRKPDAKGYAHWVGLLNSGTSRGAVMVGFSESPEFVTRSKALVWSVETRGPVSRLYMAYFGRKPDAKGLHYWGGTGFSYEAISEAFAESPEFKKRYGKLTNAQFVDLVYKNVLKRKPDAKGRKTWLAGLDAGMSRGGVMLGFSNSKEFIKKTKTLA